MLRSAKDRLQDDRPLIIFPKEPDANRDRNHVINPVSPSCIKISTYRLFLSPSTPAFLEKSSFMRYPGKVIFEFMEPLPAGMDKKPL